MSLVTYKNMSKFPIKAQLTVSGYIHQAQSLFDGIDNPYYNIPSAINHICLCFYYINIGWDKKKCATGLEISGEQQNTVTVGSKIAADKRKSVHHKVWYHSQSKGIVKFRIKVWRLNNVQNL